MMMKNSVYCFGSKKKTLMTKINSSCLAHSKAYVLSWFEQFWEKNVGLKNLELRIVHVTNVSKYVFIMLEIPSAVHPRLKRRL